MNGNTKKLTRGEKNEEIFIQNSAADMRTGHFKKLIDDHGTLSTDDDTYVMTDGNYTDDGADANALDLISGTGNGSIAMDGTILRWRNRAVNSNRCKAINIELNQDIRIAA